MKFKRLLIKNFRNFKEVCIDIQNQNVIFGMNDMGKTNLLTAIRFLLEREIRNQGFTETDFYQNNTDEIIHIKLEIDISDIENEHTQLLLAKVRGARNSDEANVFYIELTGEYDGSEYYGVPSLKWGSDIDNMSEIPQKGSFSDLDRIFKVIYIDPSIDLMTIFNKNRRKFFDEVNLSADDQIIQGKIKTLSERLNDLVSGMEAIKSFEMDLTFEYKKFRKENINVEMKSELEIKGYFSDLIPYIKREQEDKYYPTSGDGRKKLLAYSLMNYIIRESEKNKIKVFLIEEPENQLHRTMQIALSKQLFSDSIYNYFFLSTHSEEMLYEMDNTTLVRVYSKERPVCDSYTYSVPDDYKHHKKILNRLLVTGLFASKVLLVEGPSEQILFEKILSVMNPNYEVDGNYILNINGIAFDKYYKVLKALGIKVLVKTDNDLKKKKGDNQQFDLIGLNRCLKLIDKPSLEAVDISYSDEEDMEEKVKYKKKEVFSQKTASIKELNDYGIYLSEIDLEVDLDKALDGGLNEILDKNDGVKFLQTAKMMNMNLLITKLTYENCHDIYNDKLFSVLREFD